jgi:hypothetical protein
MSVSFTKVRKDSTYSRNTLARLWGYSSFHAIARGVVTPAHDNKIILFVTEEKQEAAEPYQDKLFGHVLTWEGPTDHFAENRMINADLSGEEVHLFYRRRHHTDFTYYGRLKLMAHTRRAGRPSQFTFEVR